MAFLFGYLFFLFCISTFSTIKASSIEDIRSILDRLSFLEKKTFVIDQLQKENEYLKSSIDNYEKKLEEMEANYVHAIDEMQTKIEEYEKQMLKMTDLYTDKLDGLVYKTDNEKTSTKSTSACKNYFHYLTKRVVKQDNILKKQQIEIDFLRNRISVLEKDNIWKSKHIKNDVNGVNSRKTPKENGKQIEPMSFTNNTSWKEFLTSVRQKRSVVTPVFAAGLSTTLDHSAPGHVIAFDHIYINEGNAYNGNDGIFVCPIAGLYLFSYNIHLETPGKLAGVQLKVNGKGITQSFSDTMMQTEKANVPGTTVVRLNLGDHVWIGVSHDGTHACGGYYSNIAGVLNAE